VRLGHAAGKRRRLARRPPQPVGLSGPSGAAASPGAGCASCAFRTAPKPSVLRSRAACCRAATAA
jgi:hypothetical protein